MEVGKKQRLHQALALFAAALAAVYMVLTIWSVIAPQRACAGLERDGRPMRLAALMPPPVQERGAWPESLTACMEAVPLDPCDGQPLTYGKTANGFVIASGVMEDRKSDRHPIIWDFVDLSDKHLSSSFSPPNPKERAFSGTEKAA